MKMDVVVFVDAQLQDGSCSMYRIKSCPICGKEVHFNVKGDGYDVKNPCVHVEMALRSTPRFLQTSFPKDVYPNVTKDMIWDENISTIMARTNLFRFHR